MFLNCSDNNHTNKFFEEKNKVHKLSWNDKIENFNVYETDLDATRCEKYNCVIVGLINNEITGSGAYWRVYAGSVKAINGYAKQITPTVPYYYGNPSIDECQDLFKNKYSR
jgi:hypothetical protein